MDTEPGAAAPRTFYEAVGGDEFFDRLVHRFYELVADDPELRAVYPAQDLQPAEDHLRLFLIQYWGGPQTYNELRGHPRLRMRHVRFDIDEAARDAWDARDRAGQQQDHPRPARWRSVSGRMAQIF